MTTKRRIMSEKKENEEDSQEFVAKCANHLSLALLRRRENQSELCYESDEDNNSVLKKSSISTRSKRIKKSNSKPCIELNNLDDPGMPKEESDMIRLAGGAESAQNFATQCEENLKNGTKKFEPKHGGDTLLMEKCIQKRPLSDKSFWTKNYAQILAYAKLMASSRPELLIHRNYQNASALDLAALNNKSVVAVFLSRVLESKGFNPNAPNDQGHTVLHLLARKGDDCSSTLEALLAMRKASDPQERLFRIDVVNQGHKTPLDVALICSHKYATGKDRAIYTETINLFQDVIIDEAKNFMYD